MTFSKRQTFIHCYQHIAKHLLGRKGVTEPASYTTGTSPKPKDMEQPAADSSSEDGISPSTLQPPDPSTVDRANSTKKEPASQAVATVDIVPVPDIKVPRANSTPICIEGGVHDFDFRNRPKSAASNRLMKRPPMRENRRSASSATGGHQPQRSTSRGSTHSITRRISALLQVGTNQPASPKQPQTQRDPQTPKTPDTATNGTLPDDPLPDTKEALEARMNYHLAELDRLKKSIRTCNEMIREHAFRRDAIRRRAEAETPRAVQELQSLVKFARDSRNGYGPFVTYHRGVLERIATKREQLDVAMGLQPMMPQVLKNLDNDFEWRELFIV